jgi:subtilisin family serine protease
LNRPCYMELIELQIAGMAIANAPWATLVNVTVIGPGTFFDTMLEGKRILTSKLESPLTIIAINDVISDHNANKAKGVRLRLKPFQACTLTFTQDPNWKGSAINISWKASDVPTIRSAIADAIKAGIVVVTSAGNNGQDGGTTPCGYPNIICVGGVTKAYEKATISNYGTGVTLLAPSEELKGPSIKSDFAFATDSGTSFAAPAVAAVASVFISFEGISDDVKKVLQRLAQNWHAGVLVDTTGSPARPNILLHTGMTHPNRDANYPYVGPGPVPDGTTIGMNGSIDGTGKLILV